MKVEANVEFEITPIRHILIQCPFCGKWHNGRDIVENNDIHDMIDVELSTFFCPECGKTFGGDDYDFEVQECDSTEIIEFMLSAREKEVEIK